MDNLAIPAKNRPSIAVLIDGDNAQPSLLEKILLEVSRYGRPTVRRIYGDWTAANMISWKLLLHDHAILPIQQFRNTTGKNATDSALIIDAMDILNSQQVKGFCIVSSDSDYTRLATRIREDGVFVLGIGKKITPMAFVKACDVFIHTEILGDLNDIQAKDESNNKAVPDNPTKPKPTKSATLVAKPKTSPAPKTKKAEPKTNKVQPKQPQKKPATAPPVKMLQKAFELNVQEDGWANLSGMGTTLRQIDPAFDPRTWGYSQLSQLVKAAGNVFELKKPNGPGATGPFVALKKAVATKSKAKSKAK